MKKFSSRLSTLAVGALMTMIGISTAHASPIVTQIGPTGCGNNSCQGGIYTLSVDFVSSDATNSTYDVSLSIDTTTGPYTGGGAYITSASAKISSAIVSATQTGAPTAGFTTMTGGLNAGGCDGSGGGFFCSGVPNDGSAGYGATVGDPASTNTWTWQVVIANNSLFTDLQGASVKVRYANWDDGSLNKVGALVSEDFGPGTYVPEPTTYLLTGFGLVGLGLVRRYRKSA